MISKQAKSLLQRSLFSFCSVPPPPILYGNNRSVISISQWWDGKTPPPSDYFVQDSLQQQVCKEWTLHKGMFRVLFTACLNVPSMDINVNQLYRSFSLNQLTQLSAGTKEKLVDNPSTVIIKPTFDSQFKANSEQIAKNMLELDKLFENAVGLKTSYLIDWQSLSKPEYMSQIKKRHKAISADVALAGQNLADVVFQHGHKLQHVFYCSPYGKNVCKADLGSVLEAMTVIDFKGKLVLAGGKDYEIDFKVFQEAAKQKGFTERLQYSLQTDGWYTMI